MARHLLDSVAVAGLLWDQWLPKRTQQLVSAALPRGLEDGRLLLRWLAGVHDIGKISRAFACQVPDLADRMHAKGLTFSGVPANRKALPHGLAGQVAVDRFLEQHGWSQPVARTYSIVVASHHGVPPTRQESRDAPRRKGLLGDGAWDRSREELLDHVTEFVGARERLQEWSRAPLPVPVQVLLTAAAIVTDWIASNQDLFPLDSDRDSEKVAVEAWKLLGLPAPWRPSPDTDGEDLFRKRFDLAADTKIRPLQAECVRLAESLDEPGLMIVEAPMGEGKTEAALLAAEVLARRFGVGGVFVALPTMATSNAMFDRVHEWAENLPDTAGSMFLAHGKAALNDTFNQLRRKGFASIGIDCGHQDVIAHSWYVGKKGPLANIVVGTIDQVLRASLKTRHVMLRHLALANKVVVIDEVHAADSYMSTYLERCLEWLGAYRVPVVLMSATLPPAQRLSLLQAYQRGVNGTEAGMDDIAVRDIYPCVTVWPSSVDAEPIAPSGRATDVRIEHLGDEIADVLSVLEDALPEGGVVGIVCNTVARAQELFEALRSSGRFDSNDELLLLHSRFVAPHRAEREKRLRALLGPPGKADRPKRFIVVGTQVIEQSLDIDVDLLITDLAPIDLLLQRVGRLHRHLRDSRPARVVSARCLIRGADWSGAVPVPVVGSVAVYQAARLLRAAAVLDRRSGGQIQIPGDVPALVADGYAESFVAPEGWESEVEAAERTWAAFESEQRVSAGTYLLGRPFGESASLRGWLTAAAPDVDGAGGQAQVRDGEDTIEAIVVRRDGDDVYVLDEVADYGGRLVPTEGPPPSRLAKALAGCTIRLPAALTRYGRMDAVLDTLEKNWYPGWQQSHWLAGELVLELDTSGSAIVAGHRLHYDTVLGLRIERMETPQ
ncbi:CRISPR-associated helicase Cas3' [Nocardia uniformis]|uniref:CRISPR-associated helicase Cas3 n=1 Tax=Nocardia uniformis TaxID=53432 RepID=A0A849C7M8_9NOCA|nr:CRISPR-associated helicase Cas3' [Nocardia uniformis]